MELNCDVPFYAGPLFLLLGCGALMMGALAWNIPLPTRFKSLFSRVVDTEPALDSASSGQWVWKLLGPLNGSVFAFVGFYMIWGTLHCRHISLGVPDVHGPLAFTWWGGIYLAVAIAVGIGIYNARAYQNSFARALLVLGSFGFGLAGGEAAGFHVGVHAAQWEVIAFACWALIGISYWIEVLTQKRRKAKENAGSDPWSLQAQGPNWAIHEYQGPEQRTRREDGLGVCEHCNSRFSYYLVHSGFNDSSYAYCDSCGCTAILDDYAPRPSGVPFERFKRITTGVEPYLERCECGGRFTAAGEPRCSKCNTTLSAIAATIWIEHNAPGTSQGWHWQRTWDDLYCIVIEGHVISNPWRH